MTQPDNPNDFVSPNNQPYPRETPSGSKALSAVLIIAGIGCGCSGLVMFLGIIAAIALPVLYNASDQGRQREALIDMWKILQAQQVRIIEHKSQSFAQSLSELDITSPPNNPKYRYQILKQKNLKQSVFITAQPIKPNLKSYTGAVFLFSGRATVAGVCESLRPQVIPPDSPILFKEEFKERPTIKCATGSQMAVVRFRT